MNSKVRFSVLLLLLGVFGCAQSQVSKEVDQQAAKEPPRSMHGAVASKGMDAILKSPSLTQPQKEEFLALHKKVMRETFAIQDQISKLKGVLFQTLAATPYNPEKTNEVKKRLIQLNNKKMENMLDALNSVQKIMGYMPPEERRSLMHEFEGLHERAL